jgi:hypothetical protein
MQITELKINALLRCCIREDSIINEQMTDFLCRFSCTLIFLTFSFSRILDLDLTDIQLICHYRH